MPELRTGIAHADAYPADDAGDKPLNLVGGKAVRASAAVLTSGALIWLLRSSYWAYLLILGLPLWRDVDLLPIAARELDSTAPSTREELAAARVLDERMAPRSKGRLRS